MNKTLVIVGAFMFIFMSMGVYGWLSVHHIDTAGFYTVFGTMVTTLVGLLYNNKMTSDTRDKVDTVNEKVDTVVKQTNGLLHAALEELPTKIADAVTDKGNE
jgi:ABC-type transporter MlaC component